MTTSIRKSKEAMVFQVRKWGWKRLASKLLLIPVLTGGAATVAHAQISQDAVCRSRLASRCYLRKRCLDLPKGKCSCS